ncbi:MAG: hypothetical protein KatS3mg020_0367 [Fimbriimonadales bacterium]|nr:MAG: hypothetical protein KatS3mg020_0367 [Fimbriimonadales bacterium]
MAVVTALEDYQLFYYSLFIPLVVFWLLAHWRVKNWQRLFLSAGVLYWLMVVVSFVVVEVLGEREGRRLESGELVFVSFDVASAGIVTILVIFSIAYMILVFSSLLYRKIFH